MTYAVQWRNRAERELVERARALTGLSQAAYTRVCLLKDASDLMRRVQELQKQGVSRGQSSEGNVAGDVAEATVSQDAGGDLVADSATTESEA